MYKVGSKLQLHKNVNIDPLGSHCSLCGKRTKSRLRFPITWDGEVATNLEVVAYESDLDAILGWFPVGSDCAKKFDSGIVSTR